MGMDFTGVHPDQIKIYGNGGQMLAERNSDFRYDDLQEIAIRVADGGNGVLMQAIISCFMVKVFCAGIMFL